MYEISPGSFVEYFSDFIPEKVSIKSITKSLHWRDDKISFFGKSFDQPRLVSWVGDQGAIYQYSNIIMRPDPWTKALLEIKQQLESYLKSPFNSVLVNLYRNGEDYMSWHSDNEKELGENPIIASLSLGATRDFYLRHKEKEYDKIKLELKNGSLLVMKGDIQNSWQHCLPKRKKIKKERLNLTFRNIL